MAVPRRELDSPPQPLGLDREKLRLLVYGEFGRGKTTLAGTFPKPLIIDTNGGLISIALGGNRADTFEPSGHEDLESLYWWIKDRSDSCETIVIDTLDSLVYLLMDEISDDAVEFKRREGKKVSLRMQYVPEQGDYYANQRQMNRFLFELRRLGKHMVVTSSLRYTNGRTAPNVSPGMERVVCDWASVIGELIILDEVSSAEKAAYPELEPGCRVLLTQESNARATKSRFRSLKPFVVVPTYERMWETIQQEYNQAQEVTQ